jgi:hypothetical protein
MAKFIPFVFFFFITPLHASVYVEKLDTVKKIATVKVQEKIQYEEEDVLKSELDKLESEGYKLKLNAIQVNTRGGNRFAAMAMGRLIRERKLNTYVAKDSECGSACIYVVSGGLVRMIYGKVTVHRSSFNDDIKLEKIEKLTKASDEKTAKHIQDMGLSTLVTDAILMTPNWAYRELTEQELRRWGVNATDRMYEEMWFRNAALQSKLSLEKVRDIFDNKISSCVKYPQRFEMTLWYCIELEIKKSLE